MPHRLHFRLCLALLLVGCGGKSSPAPDGPPAPDAAPADAPADAVPAAADAAFDRAADARDAVVDAGPQPDLGPAPMAQPLPANVKPPQRLLAATDHLTGEGESACSSPAVATADRWCVFYRKGVDPLAELWVINVTKAAAGIVPLCDGTSPDCIRLSTTLWTGFSFTGPAHPFSHQFEGDTLYFYADNTTGSQDRYAGPVSAWRPGWAQPRALTSGKGILCLGHHAKPLAYCIDALDGDPTHPDTFELRAGSVDGTGPVPSLGRIRPYRTTGAVAWQAGFSPDGEQFAVSSLEPDPEVVVLRAIATKDIGTKPFTPLLYDASYWAISNDSKRIYYFRAESGDLNSLHAADFPTGAGEVRLSAGVHDFLLLGDGAEDQGVGFLAELDNNIQAFRVARNSRVADSAVTIFSYGGILEGVVMSDDLRYTAWLDGRFIARVVRSADLSACRLNLFSPTSAYSPIFLRSAGLTFWAEDVTNDGIARDGFYGRPDDCGGRQRFAARVATYSTLGDRGLVYADESDGVQRATLKYVATTRAGDAWSLGTPVRVHEKVDEGSIVLVGSSPALVLYTTAGAQGGTWVFGPPL
jgi:hypothetical protein